MKEGGRRCVITSRIGGCAFLTFGDYFLSVSSFENTYHSDGERGETESISDL